MTISITATHIRQTVVAEAVEYALRECLFLLVYDYKDMFDHGVWAVLTKDDPRPADSQLLCTINHEGRVESTIAELLKHPLPTTFPLIRYHTPDRLRSIHRRELSERLRESQRQPAPHVSTQVQRNPAMSRQKPHRDNNYEQMVRERMTKYKCSRIVIQRGQSAFWSTDEDNADKQLARDAGASTLEEYLQFFADQAHRADLIIRAQISGEPLEVLRLFFPWLGSDEPVNAADQVDALNQLYDALQPPTGDKLRCPHCGYDGEQETPEGTFRILSDETIYREVIGKAVTARKKTLLVESVSQRYDEDEEKRDRLECRSCFGEFPIPAGLNVDYQ